MKKLLLLACIAPVSLLAACDDSDNAKRAAEDMGFHDVQTQGYAVFGCSDSDTFHTAFTATNADGRHVTGVVCSGWLKGATVRTF